MAFMIGQILIAPIPFGDTEFFLGHAGVPTDEIRHIIKIVSISPIVSRGTLIPIPSAIFHLAIAIGTGGAKRGNQPKKSLSRRAGTGVKPGFLKDDGHLHPDGCTPGFSGRLSSLIPIWLFFKNRTNVIWPRGRTTGAGGNEGQNTDCADEMGNAHKI